uniref:Uncharacterized protein n=1 Tax=Anopheles albimanus TaxID=7167 RepID=A0A182F0T0_ANOAL
MDQQSKDSNGTAVAVAAAAAAAAAAAGRGSVTTQPGDFAAAAAVMFSLQNTMVTSLQQAALMPANSAAAAALNLQALESYLTLQRITSKSEVLRLSNASSSGGGGGGGGGGQQRHQPLPSMPITGPGSSSQISTGGSAATVTNILQASSVSGDSSDTIGEDMFMDTSGEPAGNEASASTMQQMLLQSNDLGSDELPVLDQDEDLNFDDDAPDDGHSDGNSLDTGYPSLLLNAAFHQQMTADKMRTLAAAGSGQAPVVSVSSTGAISKVSPVVDWRLQQLQRLTSVVCEIKNNNG